MQTSKKTRTIKSIDADRRNCPLCDSEDTHVFLELSDMPAQDGVVYATRQAAIDAPVGDIILAVCRRCHYIGNLAYDAEKINFTEYNYSQRHSQQYQCHVDAVVTTLVDKYSIRDGTVVDVGCGEGHFLREICRAGANRGVGIDPSLAVADDSAIDGKRLEFFRDFYSEQYWRYKGDLVSCRHVLDELSEPKKFLQLIMGSLGDDDDAIIYLELPNALHTFDDNLIWNIGYAKRSWFTAESLRSLLQICGLQVVATETLFGGEYLGCVGRRIPSLAENLSPAAELTAETVSTLDGFAHHLKCEVQRWQQRIADLVGGGEQMVIWGAGMRGVNFLQQFGDEQVFPKIVDINPDRQGSYLPGSGYLIESPLILKECRPSRVLLSNPNYRDEIKAQLDEMGVNCTLETM